MSAPVLSPPEFAVPAFGDAVLLAVDAGLAAAAVLDAKGKVLAIAGVLEDEEARALAAHTTHDRTTDLFRRMLDGEMLRAQLPDRDAEIGIAGGCVLLVVVFPRGKSATLLGVVNQLRSDIAYAVHRANHRPLVPTTLLPPPRSGGSSSGPAELPVIEVGMTVSRRSRN